MRFETMADDVAALLRGLGLERAAIMGFSLGGGVGLRTAIQHPQVVERLVLVSTPFKRQGWYPGMLAGQDAMGPETARQLMQTPLYEAYPGLPMPVMLVVGDADGMPPSHAVQFFGLLGGGRATPTGTAPA